MGALRDWATSKRLYRSVCRGWETNRSNSSSTKTTDFAVWWGASPDPSAGWARSANRDVKVSA